MTSISVIIPTFNRPELVPLAIKSVLAQTHAASEIIVVDDGSKDDMRAVLAGFGTKIRVIRQANTGLSGARNSGLLAAASEWVAFLDDDDEYGADRLARAAESIHRFPSADAHLTNTAIVSENEPELNLFQLRGMPSDPWMNISAPLAWVLKGCFFAQSLVVRRRAIEEIGMFRKTFYEDMDLFVRLVPRKPWIIDGSPSLRLIRRRNTNPMSDAWRSKPLERCRALVRIHREALALGGLEETEKQIVRDGLSVYLYELGCSTNRTGDSSNAKGHFAEALSLTSSSRTRLKLRAAYWGGTPAVKLLEWRARRIKGFVR